ncbi:hypothetical protein HMPREF9440_00344 [Sutterella parvirubra YIT 11816]|uniref:Uncharacterized protein n=1 Tax=Sutterella parvirubra YIT 11816 TaxID=762967 RepID=H3KC94_9BURK|nr:hypothetical protein HMPREF9440_00344 [Sutterella parvirubra YIT 11816]
MAQALRRRSGSIVHDQGSQLKQKAAFYTVIDLQAQSYMTRGLN